MMFEVHFYVDLLNTDTVWILIANLSCRSANNRNWIYNVLHD